MILRRRTFLRQSLLAACGLMLAACTPAAPSFTKWKASQAIDAFKAAGLEAENPTPMTEPKDYGLAPYLTKDAIHFLTPSLDKTAGDGSGGRVFSFANADDLAKMKTYYETLGKQSAMFASWVYTRDNILVQINGQMPEAQAKKYEAALNSMK